MNSETLWSWQVWAVLSAVFAALTAIFAKIGVAEINSDLATFIRTIVVLVALAADPGRHRQIRRARADHAAKLGVSGAVRSRHRRVVAVLFPRVKARAGVAGGADRQIERGAGGAVRRRVSRRAAVAEPTGSGSR